MLGGLLSRGFSAKCKSLIKMIRARIDVIRRKRNATQKFLKKDIADLLANGLDINAYGRADGLLVELDLSSCYEFVEKSCELVAKHLSVMQKQSECPEDCREAVSSLMFAAARFSDLPELRELRKLFQEKYGNSLDYFANKEFVEKLTSKPSTIERRVKLLQSIALEFSINWDDRAFEQRVPTSSLQEQPKTYGPLQPKNRYGPVNGQCPIPKGDISDASSRDGNEVNNHKHELCDGKEKNFSKRKEIDLQSRQEAVGAGCKPCNGWKVSSLKKDGSDISFRERQEGVVGKPETWNKNDNASLETTRLGSLNRGKRQESVDGGSGLYYRREHATPFKHVQGTLPNGDPHGSNCSDPDPRSEGKRIPQLYNVLNSTLKIHERNSEKLDPSYNNFIPPPYVKPNSKGKDCKFGATLGSVTTGFDNNGGPGDNPIAERSTATSRVDEVRLEHAHHKMHDVRFLAGPNYREGKEHHLVEMNGESMPVSRSLRRRHSKSRSTRDHNNEDIGVKRKSRSRKRLDSRRGLQQILYDDDYYQKDEEERIIDRLLMHYSKKTSNCESGMVKRKPTTQPVLLDRITIGESQHHGNKDESDEESEVVPHTVRSVSLPREHTAPSEAKKTFARAASFQPARSSPARHVHPKLPDYDDLAARFAALKGR